MINRLLVVVALALVASSASASAGGWVRWVEHFHMKNGKVESHTQWPTDAFDSKKECQAEIDSDFAAGKIGQHPVDGDDMYETCFPSDFDTREKGNR
jgi:hypothetical protein